MSKVIVVGGGIAGLTAAWRLQCAGHQIEVLEREAAAGGRMRCERRGGFLVDSGAQFIFSGYKDLHALASEVGLADQVRPVGRTSSAVLRDGQLHAADYKTPLAFLRSPLLSLGSKLRLPRVMLQEIGRAHV